MTELSKWIGHRRGWGRFHAKAPIYWTTLKNRLKSEGSQLVTNCDQLKMPDDDGKSYLTDVATAETLLRLASSIQHLNGINSVILSKRLLNFASTGKFSMRFMNPFDELRARAEKGDARAQLDLALAYQKPFGQEQDPAQAFEWCRKAADQGLDEAQFQLGLMFQFGIGVKKDCAEAVKWLGKAADQGHLAAGNQLGWIYRTGRDVEENRAEAIKWFRKVADQGGKAAQYNLGALYAEGQDLQKDDTEAVKWLLKAANQGHTAAQYALGGMYAEGRGVEKDDALALEWFRKAADQGYAAAQSNLRRWPRTPGQDHEMTHSSQPDKDVGTILKASQRELRILGIRRVEVGELSLRILALIAHRSPPFAGISEIVCFNAVDYAIRPQNPALILGGPAIEFHDNHPLLQAAHLQLVPGGDGEIFRPPLDLKLLILDQSHVIAERFEIRNCADDRLRPRNPQ